MKEPKLIELDGRTGEGGGQLVRMAVSLAAVLTQPIRITHVRGNRGGSRGGGLKAQHVASIAWLAKATDADVTGLSVGSHTLEFRPRLPPSQLTAAAAHRRVSIAADSAAASTLLILQAIFPFLLFAGSDDDGPIEVDLSGGTNVAWSLSYEYLAQVLLPTLRDRFGVRAEAELRDRGWSVGTRASEPARGHVRVRVWPLRVGETLRPTTAGLGGEGGRREVTAVDVSVVAPAHMHADLQGALFRDLDVLFPGAGARLEVLGDSGLDCRIYVLLVARSGTLRWGRDILTSAPKKGNAKGKGKGKGGASLSDSIAGKVCKDLYEEVALGGVVDEFLQDQLVVFQALAEGETSFPRDGDGGDGWGTPRGKAGLEKPIGDLNVGERRRKDKTHEPFGQGSTHTTTARWVAAELLPRVVWYNKGSVCQGAGVRMEPAT
ncbi:EPT/RTPC-like protein [Phialemonium atrogriseum]|uniref:EPT/RTPC-like protein n=1 Tax=Phialemonium atrogriseum TaxID=1093897 RepID=A0AAJ0BT89_9PEZI|nr:EPT/RTPC-like protein [Phialemonium atrogriseum]KAK1763607.1 EPT/RTPC-like protein [Phialemonium atrogriseum]